MNSCTRKTNFITESDYIGSTKAKAQRVHSHPTLAMAMYTLI